MDFYYTGLTCYVPLTSEELHWSSYITVLLSHYHELLSTTMELHQKLSDTPAFFNILFSHLSFRLSRRLHLAQIIFSNLDLLALLMFPSSVSVLAKVIYIFLSPDWKGEVLLTSKENLLRYNYSIYLPLALSSIYLSSLSILSSLTLTF